jgi:hypothetical protein
MFNPEPMTRREQEADQQARAQTASWGQGQGLKQQQAGLEGVAQQLSGHGRTVDEDLANKKRATRSRCVRRRRKRTTAKQKDSGRFQVVNRLEKLQAVKQREGVLPSSLVFPVQTQLAKTDAAEPCGRKDEGCVPHCRDGSAATLADGVIAPARVAFESIAGTHAQAPTAVAEALLRPDGPDWEKALLAEVGSCLKLGVWEACEL